MAGNINKLFVTFLLFFLISCQKLSKNDEKGEVYISIKNNINYNADTIEYYIVNKTNKDLRILCNPDFFKRQKDSLFVDTIFNPQIRIYNDKELVEPILLNVNYAKKILDSLSKVTVKYTEVSNLNKIKYSQLNILKKYVKTIKKNDSIKLSTKINFENEPRFYDYSENEGYILKNGGNYFLEMSLNENLNTIIKSFLDKENIYFGKIFSNRKKLIFVKTNYSE